jgi:hypothetical protein
MNAAVWLMQRFGVPDALIGDLVEQQRAGRSSVWLWHQVIVTVVETTHRAIRNQKGNALVTALLSAAALFVWVKSTWALYLWVSERWMNAWAAPGAAWVDGVRVGGFWSRAVFVWWELYGGGLVLLWCVGSALIGRVVARTQSVALVLVSVAAQLPFVLWWGVPIWLHAGSRYGVAPIHPLNFWVSAAVVLVGMPFSTVIAGLCATPRHRIGLES